MSLILGFLGRRRRPAAPPAVNPASARPETDAAAFADMVDRLMAAGMFQEARYGPGDEVLFPSADQVPFAAVVPSAVVEVDTWDQGNAIRTVSYRLLLVVRSEEPEARQGLLGQLEAAARNALSGRSYGGFTFPALSRLGRTTWPKSRSPEQKVEILGSFAYEVAGYGTRDLTNTYYE